MVSSARAPSTASAPAAAHRRRVGGGRRRRSWSDYLHLHLLNRGVLITPFHNMALMCPATTEADVDRHTEAFEQAVAALFAA